MTHAPFYSIYEDMTVIEDSRQMNAFNRALTAECTNNKVKFIYFGCMDEYGQISGSCLYSRNRHGDFNTFYNKAAENYFIVKGC